MSSQGSPWAPKVITDQEATGQSFRDIMAAQQHEATKQHYHQNQRQQQRYQEQHQSHSSNNTGNHSMTSSRARGKPVVSQWTGSGQITPSRGRSRSALQGRQSSEQVAQTSENVTHSNDTRSTEHVASVDSNSNQGSSAMCAGKTTTVVNVRKGELRKFGYNDLEDWLQYPDHVYIGRDMTCYVRGAKGSKWGNPFKSRQCGREESCARYRDYVLRDRRVHDNGRTLLESLGELKGKTLGCWCHPEHCHGHELVKLIEEHCE